jgi:DNA mismatch endonuclease (patch repair protein)
MVLPMLFFHKAVSSLWVLVHKPRNVALGMVLGMDVLTPEQRKLAMSRIKSKDTSIEVMLRKALWRKGVRYRKNYGKLPGSPDIAITKYQIAVFCDGEFFHGYDWENRKEQLDTNKEYWTQKIQRNIARDKEVNDKLQAQGWIVIRFWGRDIKKNLSACVSDVQESILEKIIDSYEELIDTEDMAAYMN